MKTEQFKVKGMHCASCEMLIQDAIGELDGVETVSASTKKGVVEVSFDEGKVKSRGIKETIEKEGYTVH